MSHPSALRTRFSERPAALALAALASVIAAVLALAVLAPAALAADAAGSEGVRGAFGQAAAGDSRLADPADAAGSDAADEVAAALAVEVVGADELALGDAVSVSVAQPALGAFRVEVLGVDDSAEAVLVPMWCVDGDQDDLVWYTAEWDGSCWYVESSVDSHLGQEGTYAVHVYVRNADGQLTLAATAEAPVAASEIPIYRLYNKYTSEHLYTSDENERNVLYESEGWGFEGTGWYAPSCGTPVYRLYNAGLGSHLYTTDLNEVSVLTAEYGWTVDNDGNPLFYSGCAAAVYRVYNESLGGLHHLTMDANEYAVLPGYGWDQEGVSLYASSEGEPLSGTHYYPASMYGYLIMGASDMSAADMAECYRWWVSTSGSSFPTEYASLGASNVDDFFAILAEEAEAEGVRAEIVFAQAMWETGWLHYNGSDVKLEQCNFAGIGVYGGSTGVDFSSYGSDAIRMGFRCQVQYLKGYASEEPLVNDCVASSYYSIDHGCAPTLQDLDGRWAGSGYGDNLESFIYYLESRI